MESVTYRSRLSAAIHWNVFSAATIEAPARAVQFAAKRNNPCLQKMYHKPSFSPNPYFNPSFSPNLVHPNPRSAFSTHDLSSTTKAKEHHEGSRSKPGRVTVYKISLAQGDGAHTNSAFPSTMGKSSEVKLFVGGLRGDVDKAKVAQLFSKLRGVERVVDVDVHRNLGNPLAQDAIAYITMMPCEGVTGEQASRQAIQAYHNCTWRKAKLRVEKPKPDYLVRLRGEQAAIAADRARKAEAKNARLHAGMNGRGQAKTFLKLRKKRGRRGTIALALDYKKKKIVKEFGEDQVEVQVKKSKKSVVEALNSAKVSRSSSDVAKEREGGEDEGEVDLLSMFVQEQVSAKRRKARNKGANDELDGDQGKRESCVLVNQFERAQPVGMELTPMLGEDSFVKHRERKMAEVKVREEVFRAEKGDRVVREERAGSEGDGRESGVDDESAEEDGIAFPTKEELAAEKEKAMSILSGVLGLSHSGKMSMEESVVVEAQWKPTARFDPSQLEQSEDDEDEDEEDDNVDVVNSEDVDAAVKTVHSESEEGEESEEDGSDPEPVKAEMEESDGSAEDKASEDEASSTEDCTAATKKDLKSQGTEAKRGKKNALPELPRSDEESSMKKQLKKSDSKVSSLAEIQLVKSTKANKTEVDLHSSTAEPSEPLEKNEDGDTQGLAANADQPDATKEAKSNEAPSSLRVLFEESMKSQEASSFSFGLAPVESPPPQESAEDALPVQDALIQKSVDLPEANIKKPGAKLKVEGSRNSYISVTQRALVEIEERWPFDTFVSGFFRAGEGYQEWVDTKAQLTKDFRKKRKDALRSKLQRT